jgi:hypothetical protein
MSHLIGRTLRQVPDDPHALPSMREAATRAPRQVWYEPDAIERVCAMCTLEYRDGRWQHSRGCILG